MFVWLKNSCMKALERKCCDDSNAKCVRCNYIAIYLLSVDTRTFESRLRQLSDFKQVTEQIDNYCHEVA